MLFFRVTRKDGLKDDKNRKLPAIKVLYTVNECKILIDPRLSVPLCQSLSIVINKKFAL